MNSCQLLHIWALGFIFTHFSLTLANELGLGLSGRFAIHSLMVSILQVCHLILKKKCHSFVTSYSAPCKHLSDQKRDPGMGE